MREVMSRVEDRIGSLTGPEGRRQEQPGPAPAFWRRVWERWKRFGHTVGDFQARVILTLIYFIILAPYGCMVRLFSDPLNTRRPGPASTWIARKRDDSTLGTARRQF